MRQIHSQFLSKIEQYLSLISVVLIFMQLSKPMALNLLMVTHGVNFINDLRAAFMREDPESAKKTVKSVVTFGTYGHKSCT